MRYIIVRRANPTPERMSDLYSWDGENPNTIYGWNKSFQVWYELGPTSKSSVKLKLNPESPKRYGVIRLGQSIMLNGIPTYVNRVNIEYVTLNSDNYTNDDLLCIAPNYDGSGFVHFDGLTKPKKYFGEMPKFKFV
jgi:hypothetical protein